MPCDEPIGHDIYNRRIVSQKSSHDTLILEVSFVHNCAAELEAELKATNDSLFINLENVSEVYAACNCSYSMFFMLTEVQDSCFKLFVDSTAYKFSKSKYINFPPNKINKKLLKNKTNSDGKKIGYWKIKTKYGVIISYYGDGSTFNNYSLWRKKLNKKNEVVSVSILKITPDPMESYHMILERDSYLKIISEIEANL